MANQINEEDKILSSMMQQLVAHQKKKKLQPFLTQYTKYYLEVEHEWKVAESSFSCQKCHIGKRIILS